MSKDADGTKIPFNLWPEEPQRRTGGADMSGAHALQEARAVGVRLAASRMLAGMVSGARGRTRRFLQWAFEHEDSTAHGNHKEKTVPSLNDDRWDDESFFRAITDEEAEEQLRDPKRWSYIVRDPTGAVCCWGRGRSRKACEKAAIANAEIHAIERWAAAGAEDVEPWPECKCWRSDGWRFVIWPPSEKPGHSRFGGDGTNAEKVAGSIAEQREQFAPADSKEGL